MKKYTKTINAIVNKAVITENGTKLNDNHNTTLPNVTSEEGLRRWLYRLYIDREKARQRLMQEKSRFYE